MLKEESNLAQTVMNPDFERDLADGITKYSFDKTKKVTATTVNEEDIKEVKEIGKKGSLTRNHYRLEKAKE